MRVRSFSFLDSMRGIMGIKYQRKKYPHPGKKELTRGLFWRYLSLIPIRNTSEKKPPFYPQDTHNLYINGLGLC